MTSGVLRFGVFEVDLHHRELRKSGARLKIQSKPFQVLEALLEKPGELVARDELAQRLWPNLFVDFGRNLNTAVNALRRTLRDSSRNPRFIETRLGCGYIFIAPVEVAGGPHRVAQLHGVSGSIAVLPFDNGTGSPEVDYLADGIADNLIANLSGCAGLRVIARGTSHRLKARDFEPRAAGEFLNVGAVLAGHIGERGDKLLVSAELIDVQSGWRLWGARYERALHDICAVETEITREIFGALELRMADGGSGWRARRSYTDNFEAYQQYLKGRYFYEKMTEEDLPKSIAYFESALAAYPKCALTMSGLADTYALMAFLGAAPASRAQPKARELALAAVALDDELAEAHVALAGVKKNYDWDWAGAEVEYRRAIELKPRLATAHQRYASYLVATGRSAEAAGELRQALELDPLSLVINMEVAWNAYMSRDYEGAIRQAWQTLTMEPRYAPAQHALGLAYEQTGMLEEAIVELQNARVCSNQHPAALASVAHAKAAAGRHEEARTAIRELEELATWRYISSYWRAIVYAGLGETAAALACLEQACDERDVWIVWMKVEPRFDPLRADPRFGALLRRIGLERGTVVVT